ncbi:MAG: CsbD family protein [Steroidobacteraceae bacterium]
MNRNTVRNVSQGTLRQLKGKIKEQWARLNEDEIDELVGRNERLAGRLQERYGWEKEEARKQVDEFYRRHRRLH